MQLDGFNDFANQFDYSNNQLFRNEYANAILLGIQKCFLYFISFAFRIIIVYYIQLVYQNSLDGKDNVGFKNASLSVEHLFVYLVYLVELVINILKLESNLNLEIQKQVAQAEMRLFVCIKNSPIVAAIIIVPPLKSLESSTLSLPFCDALDNQVDASE